MRPVNNASTGPDHRRPPPSSGYGTLEAAANFVLDLADGGRFVHVSGGVCRLLGGSREELLRSRLTDWLPGRDGERLYGLWESLREAKTVDLPLPQGAGASAVPLWVTLEHFEFAGREQVAGHFHLLHGTNSEPARQGASRDGEVPRPCDCAVRLPDAASFELLAGSPAESCAVRTRLSLMEFALDVVPDAVCLMDEHGNFRYANQAACRERGHTREQFLSLHISDIDPELSRERWPNFQRRLESAGCLTLETRHRSRSGCLFPVQISSRRFHFDGASYVLLVARDVNDRKRLETRLRESERLHRTLMENFPDFIVRLDAECRHRYVSPSVMAFFGKPKEFFLGHTVSEIGLTGHAESDSALLESARRAIATATPNRIELKMVPTGQVFFEIRHIPELDENGRVVSVLGTARDITESRRRKRQEATRFGIFGAMALGAELPETLNRVIRYIETVIADGSVRIMLVTASGTRLVSGAASGFPEAFDRAMADVPIDAAAGCCCAAVRRRTSAVAGDIESHPDWHDCKAPALSAGFRSCWSEPIFDATGEILGTVDVYRHVPGTPSPDEREAVKRACHLAAIAISRNRLQQERDARERQYRTLAENAPAVIVRYDRQCRRVYFNKEFERINGASARQMLGRTPMELPGAIAPIAAFYQARIRTVLETGVAIEVEQEWMLPDGKDCCYVMRFVPERDAEGQIASILAVSHDSTERCRAERALQASERQFRSLVENSPDAIARYDRDGRRLYVNPAMQRELEWNAENPLGATPLEHSPLMAPQRYMDALRQVIETGNPATLETRCRHRGGSEGWGQVHFVPEQDDDGQVAGVLAIGRDNTDLVNSQRELAASRALLRDLRARSEAAREEERKRISRELHDELGQLLTTLRLNISLVRMQHGGTIRELDRAAAECIGVVDTAIKAVRRLASALRPLALDMGLAAAIQWQLDQFIGRTGVAGELGMNTDDLAPTEAQSLLIFRILQESLTNVARHAQARRVRVNLIRQGDIYILTVSDDGCGFDMSLPPRNGALGILGMHERALAAGAILTVSSAPGAGTELVLSVPV
jgi:PAS domain S-box-containing protein